MEEIFVCEWEKTTNRTKNEFTKIYDSSINENLKS